MRIALTGASGFIGTALRPALSAAGHRIAALDLRHGRVELGDAEAVVHLAAIAHRARPGADLQRVNVELAAQVGRAAASCGARMIFLSSSKVHGDSASEPLRETSPIAPQDAYGESKVRAETALRSIEGLRLTVIRPPLVYGPGVKANFLALMRAIARGWPLPLASIVNRRSLIYVGNLAHALERCLQLPAAQGRTYLVSDGAPLSTPELCTRIGEALNSRARLFRFPPSALGLLPGATRLTRSLQLDDAAIRAELGWQPPFSLSEGLCATAQWYLGR
jgi:nucleoside-diphosphate-sugar epimerase